MSEDALVWSVRSLCGTWPPWLKFWYIAANVAIALAYFSIPLTMVRLYRRGLKSILGISWQTAMWGAFILVCGIGHLVENVGAFFWPHYVLFSVIHTVTAIASVVTAVTFPIAVNGALKKFMAGGG